MSSPDDLFSELYDHFAMAVRDANSGQFRERRSPATEEEIAATEHVMGRRLPEDVKALLRVHNGGFLFDGFEWYGCSLNRDRTANWVGSQDLDRDIVFNEWDLDPNEYYVPQPGFWSLANSEGNRAILYETSGDVEGRLPILSYESAVTAGAPSLEQLVRYHIRRAELGWVGPDPSWACEPVRPTLAEAIELCDEYGIVVERATMPL